jgi:hypothetical protein
MEQRCFFNGSSAQAKRVMLQVLDLDGRNSATRAIQMSQICWTVPKHREHLGWLAIELFQI